MIDSSVTGQTTRTQQEVFVLEVPPPDSVFRVCPNVSHGQSGHTCCTVSRARGGRAQAGRAFSCGDYSAERLPAASDVDAGFDHCLFGVSISGIAVAVHSQ